MSICPQCGARVEGAVPSCPHCGHATAAVQEQPPADVTAKMAQQAFSPVSLMAVGAIGLAAVGLMFMIGSGRLSHPSSQAVSAETPAEVTPPVSDPVVQAELRPQWIGRRQAAWRYDGTRTIAFALDASNDLPIGMARARSQLVARCLARQIELYVVTGPLVIERQSTTQTVGVQIDNEPEQLQEWLPSDSSQEVFAPNGLGFVRRLASARRMRFTYTPFHAKPVTADFLVEGFDQLAPLVTRTCGTRFDPAPRQSPLAKAHNQ